MQTIVEKLRVIIYSRQNDTEIEYTTHNSSVWVLMNFDIDKLPLILADYTKFRLKGKAKYVPYSFEDNKLFRDKWFQENSSSFRFKIEAYSKKYVVISNENITYSNFFHQFKDEDGSPAGKLVE